MTASTAYKVTAPLLGLHDHKSYCQANYAEQLLLWCMEEVCTHVDNGCTVDGEIFIAK